MTGKYGWKIGLSDQVFQGQVKNDRHLELQFGSQIFCIEFSKSRIMTKNFPKTSYFDFNSSFHKCYQEQRNSFPRVAPTKWLRHSLLRKVAYRLL